MSQNSSHPAADPELEILLVEEEIIELQGKILQMQNQLSAAQTLRDAGPTGSVPVVIAEMDIKLALLAIEIYEATLTKLESIYQQLKSQLNRRYLQR